MAAQSTMSSKRRVRNPRTTNPSGRVSTFTLWRCCDLPERIAAILGIPVHAVRLPTNLAGVTDGTSIWVDHRLTSVERRCTIAHELVHIEAGHTHHQSPKVEAWVRRRTAEWLIPWEHLWAHRHSVDLYDIADQLDVTRHVLLDRLHHLTPHQKHRLAEGLAPWNS